MPAIGGHLPGIVDIQDERDEPTSLVRRDKDLKSGLDGRKPVRPIFRLHRQTIGDDQLVDHLGHVRFLFSSSLLKASVRCTRIGGIGFLVVA